VRLAPPREKTVIGEVMTQYLVAIHHPENYDPSLEGPAMERDIDVLNEEMIAKGVRIFAGGLRPASSAKSLRAQPDGKVLITDGPYLETKEHIGGFWVLEAADLDEALAWGRKAVIAYRAPVEVRPFFRSNVATEAGRHSFDRTDWENPRHSGSPRYLAAIHLPDEFDPSSVDEAMVRDIDTLNKEMDAAGVRVFAGGLGPVSSAKSLRAQPHGKVLITDGPYLETKDHIGGFSILEANLYQVLAWGRKVVIACCAPFEVRPFH
jgi:hypothetical protein